MITPLWALSLFYSMTELEKDIGNLRSGLKSVESVSQTFISLLQQLHHFKYTFKFYTLSIYVFFCFNYCYCFTITGAGLPEESPAGSRWQVCVSGEPVHHRGQLQLLRRGRFSRRSQGTGESIRKGWFLEKTTCELTGVHHCHSKTLGLKALFWFPLGAAVSTRLVDPHQSLL